MFRLSYLTFVFLIAFSNISFANVNCFQKIHGVVSKNARVRNQAASVIIFNHDSSRYFKEYEELLTKIRNWSQVGGRGQTIHSMRETGAKQRLRHLMSMASTSEVVGQLESYVKIPDMAYYSALKFRRHLQAFKHFKTVVQDADSVADFKKFGSFIALVNKEIKMKEILNDDVYGEFLELLANKKSVDQVVEKVKSDFGWLKETDIKAEVEKLQYLFKTTEFGGNCALATPCYELASQLPKVFSFDFESFLRITKPSRMFEAIDQEIYEIELRVINQAAKLYRNKSEYVAIREGLQLYFSKDLLDNQTELYELGKSAKKKMDRLDELRRMLHADSSEFDDFKREAARLRAEFPDAPEVKRFNSITVTSDMTEEDMEILKETFDRIYFEIKAAVVWYKFEPRFNLDKFGKEIGVKVELLPPGKIFQINDDFPASKIKVLHESLHSEKISAIVTLVPDETVYRILNKVSDLVTWIPGLRESKPEIKNFFQALIDEKAILETYPKVDELSYGPGTIAQRYRTFKEAAAPNSLGKSFVDIFARRADEQAQQTYDKFFKLLADEIEGLRQVDVTGYSSFSSNHPLVKLFEQMKAGRENLVNKGTLAPWFENPPNSARYFRLFASGLAIGVTSYGGYKLVNWLTDMVQGYVGDSVDEEIVDRISAATMDIVESEASAVGIDVDAIEAGTLSENSENP